MDSTEYRRTERTDERAATGHHWMFGRLRPVKDYDITILGAGSVRSSVTDMATYAEWLLHGGAGAHGNVLRPETLAEMMTRQYSVDPRLPGMGLAFFLDALEGHRVAGHDGNVPGFASALLTAPDDGVAVVVLTNTATMIGAHLLAQTVLTSLLGLPRSEPELPSATVADQPHTWSDLVGDYAPGAGLPHQRTRLANDRRGSSRRRQAPPARPPGAVAAAPAASRTAAVRHGRRRPTVVHGRHRRTRRGASPSPAAPPAGSTGWRSGRRRTSSLYRRSTLRSSRLHLRMAAASSVVAALRLHQRRRRRSARSSAG